MANDPCVTVALVGVAAVLAAILAVSSQADEGYGEEEGYTGAAAPASWIPSAYPRPPASTAPRPTAPSASVHTPAVNLLGDQTQPPFVPNSAGLMTSLPCPFLGWHGPQHVLRAQSGVPSGRFGTLTVPDGVACPTILVIDRPVATDGYISFAAPLALRSGARYRIQFYARTLTPNTYAGRLQNVPGVGTISDLSDGWKLYSSDVPSTANRMSWLDTPSNMQQQRTHRIPSWTVALCGIVLTEV